MVIPLKTKIALHTLIFLSALFMGICLRSIYWAPSLSVEKFMLIQVVIFLIMVKLIPDGEM